MQVITAANDGTVVIEFTAEEARQIRDDLGNAPWEKTSTGSDLLRSHLEVTHGPTRKASTPGYIY